MTDEETTMPTPVPDKKKEEPLSIVEEAKAIRDEIVQARDSLREENNKKEKLQADELLGSSAGGNVPVAEKSEEQQKKDDAAEFFKGTSIGEAIQKS